MRSRSYILAAMLFPCVAVSTLLSTANAQTPTSAAALIAAAEIPDAPTPQNTPAQSAQIESSTAVPDQASSSSQPAQPVSSQTPATQESRHATAARQLKLQEHQRVFGILPNFSTSYINNAASLSAGQKMHLAFRTATDSITFASASVVAGAHEALNNDPGFGWGPEGYFKRAGAAYLDAFDGKMLGLGVLPALLHQDPRYFRRGHGSFGRRLLCAIAASYIRKHDNTGRWEPSYSNVGGNMIAGAISNLYYPSQSTGWGHTFRTGFTVTSVGAVGAIFGEFWPDISRKYSRQDPAHSLDAQATVPDKAGQTSEPASQ